MTKSAAAELSFDVVLTKALWRSDVSPDVELDDVDDDDDVRKISLSLDISIDVRPKTERSKFWPLLFSATHLIRISAERHSMVSMQTFFLFRSKAKAPNFCSEALLEAFPDQRRARSKSGHRWTKRSPKTIKKIWRWLKQMSFECWRQSD